MLSLPPSVKIFVAREPVDLRNAFDGLSGVIRDILEEDPLSGHLFVFFNRRRNRAKILWWDRSGFWLLYKRLERGTFVVPTLDDASGTSLKVKASELAMILDGIDLSQAERRPRFDYARSA